MSESPKVKLRYNRAPIITEERYSLQAAVAKCAANGAFADMIRSKGVIDICLKELRPGGLERAVRDCVDLVVPLSGIHSYNPEGLTITQGVLEQLGYELGRKPFLAGLFGFFMMENNASYLPVVRIPERVREIVS